MKSLNFKIIYTSALALIAWFCVVLQFYISPDNFITVISYFTVLCNSLIAISLTFSTFFPKTKLGNFFSILSVKTAIALYIFIVFVVYNTVLRGIWKPTGWQLFLDNMLHVAIPILYILYWLFFVTKGTLNWKNGFYWLIFPLVYLIYSLIRGPIANWYPYPFLNASNLGYSQVGLNILAMLFVFLISGSALIFINNKFEKEVTN
ncbi:MAG: Pr6Pr family membrane protein [Chryseobacterium sp.]|nr:Pr6Pr family membrane protein [Chryseobacterium sp.]MBP7500121.1 Pr6Pr family membrane protein [Chryseobacterium sp.]